MTDIPGGVRMRAVLTLAVAATLVFASSCSKSSGASETTCDAGSVFDSGQCRVICQEDSQCTADEICEASLCQTGVRTDKPQIDAIDADGTTDGVSGHATHHYDGELYITGQHLAGASLSLSNGAQPWPLTVCNSSDTAIVATLPSGVPGANGNYTLTATNQAGSCGATLPILKGDAGAAGPTGATGALDSSQVSAMNAAIVAASVPVGTILPFGGAAAPSGWLLCDGSAVSRTTYANLFNVTLIAFGTGNGTSTFNLPNLTGKLPLGTSGSHALGTTGGAETHTLTVAELASHDHGGQTGGMTSGVSSDWLEYGCSGGEGGIARNGAVGCGANHLAGHVHTIAAAGSGTAHSIMPPFQAFNYIIKY
jgi:microcystin-dependent protein